MAIGWLIVGTLLMVSTNALSGLLLVPRRRLMLADALGHALFPGILLGGWLAANTKGDLLFLIPALLISWVAIWGIERMVKSGEKRTDAALAAIFSTFFAVGLLLSVQLEGKTPVNLEGVFFGNLLWIPYRYFSLHLFSAMPALIWLQLALVGMLVIAFIIGWRRFTWHAFAPESFPKLNWTSYVVSGLASFSIVVSFTEAGILFTSGTVIVPAATCWYLMRQRTHGTSMLKQVRFILVYSWLGAGAGIGLAFGFNIEPAASVVFCLTVQAIVLIGAHRLLTKRRLLT